MIDLLNSLMKTGGSLGKTPMSTPVASPATKPNPFDVKLKGSNEPVLKTAPQASPATQPNPFDVKLDKTPMKSNGILEAIAAGGASALGGKPEGPQEQQQQAPAFGFGSQFDNPGAEAFSRLRLSGGKRGIL